MQINVSELLSTLKKTEQFVASVDFDEVSLSGQKYSIVEKEEFPLTVSNAGKKKIRVEGETKVIVSIPCDRCLEEVRTPFLIHIDETLEVNPEREDDENAMDLNFIEGCMLDVDMLVYDEIVMQFPMKTLCKEDCKGLCNVCGANLNKVTCNCDRAVLDPRMSIIRDIFNNNKEV